MRENLHRFFRAARGAGVRLSPAESIDAMRAVSKVGFADRTILRDTLLLTLAKTEDEKKALGDCFDLFFDQPEPQSPPEDGKSDGTGFARSPMQPPIRRARPAAATSRPTELGQLAQMLLSQDRNADCGGDGQRGECRLAVRHPLFHPARHLLRPHPRPDGHRAPARRSRRADGDQSGAGGTADRRAGRLARARCARPSRRRCCSTGARKPKTCATKSCATRRCRGSSRGRSSRCGR